MRWARRLWFGFSAVPLGVMVNNAVLGISVIDCHNGGAKSEVFGSELPPEQSIVLARKSWTFKLAPFHAGDNVVVASPYRPASHQLLKVIGRENSYVRCREGLYVPIYTSRVWLEADESMKSEEAEDSTSYGQVPTALVDGVALAVLWPLSHAGLVSHTPVPADRRLPLRMVVDHTLPEMPELLPGLNEEDLKKGIPGDDEDNITGVGGSSEHKK